MTLLSLLLYLTHKFSHKTVKSDSSVTLNIELSKKYISAELILLACWDKMIIWQNNWAAVHHCKFFWTPCHLLLWAISELLMASSPCLCRKCLFGTWVTCWLTEKSCWVAQVTFWLAQVTFWVAHLYSWMAEVSSWMAAQVTYHIEWSNLPKTT